MKVINEYPGSHHYERTHLYCPHCGGQTVWQSQGREDFYLGSNYVCTTCEVGMYLDSAYINIPTEHSRRIVRQIVNTETDYLTTQSGEGD